ncbi:hypothetical protein MPLA_1860007 [Mesorhizobium sp. ORS 3359]|nr:hypothetical protein MPLA_1860007 [Mesorhizobium sp. ORS 3359]
MREPAGGEPMHFCEIAVWLSVIAINLVTAPLVLLRTPKREASGMAVREFLRAALCPAGQLPHLGGDWQLPRLRLACNVGGW